MKRKRFTSRGTPVVLATLLLSSAALAQAPTPEPVTDQETELGKATYDQLRAKAEIIDSSPLYDNLKPLGVMVVVEAEHTCMTLRGVKKPGAITITSAVLGGFRRDSRTRAEAMSLIKG